MVKCNDIDNIDPLFQINVISQSPNPQQVMYLALHQDYCSNYVYEETVATPPEEEEGFFEEMRGIPSEEECGAIVIKRLLAHNASHYGPLEHPSIVFSTGYFPHSVIQQLRTHRISVSFDVQSYRYTSQTIIDVALGKEDVENAFYLRPTGYYSDRQGGQYYYSELWRDRDKELCIVAAKNYADDIHNGMSEEHARGKVPFDYRQHFVVSFNVRSFMHMADLRSKKDAQLECQQFMRLAFPHFKKWVPSIGEWYEVNRLGKAKLAP